jgi:two-component system LytT family response regulator
MKIAIIDDEIHCIESLAMDLNSIDPNIKVVYKCNQPLEALEKLSKLDIDILFLDVEMPGINGFELLEQLHSFSFDIVFTTAYSQYAVQAFKLKAFNYLLKPVDVLELKEVLQQWKIRKENMDNAASEEVVRQLLEQMKKEGMLKSKIAVPIADGYEFLETNQILFCQSENNYTNIYLVNGTKLLISKTLKEVEKTLEKYLFIRIHQSYLINPNYMKKYHRKDGGYVMMDNDHRIPVSHHKKELLTGLFEAVSRNY